MTERNHCKIPLLRPNRHSFQNLPAISGEFLRTKRKCFWNSSGSTCQLEKRNRRSTVSVRTIGNTEFPVFKPERCPTGCSDFGHPCIRYGRIDGKRGCLKSKEGEKTGDPVAAVGFAKGDRKTVKSNRKLAEFA